MREADPDHAGAPRISSSGDPSRPGVGHRVLSGRPPRRNLRGRNRAGLAPDSGQPAIPGARGAGAGQRGSRPALPHHRSRTGFAPVVLPVEQHSGRRVDQPGGPEQAAHVCRLGAAGQAHAGRSEGGRTGDQFRRSVPVPAQSAGDKPRWRLLSQLGRRVAQSFPKRDRAVV